MDIKDQLAELERTREILSRIDKRHREMRELFKEFYKLPILDLTLNQKRLQEKNLEEIKSQRMNFMNAIAAYSRFLKDLLPFDFAK